MSATQDAPSRSPGRRRRRLALLLAGLGLLALAAGAWLLLGGVPFSGPYSGRVLDAATGLPISTAVADACWTCYDNPIPLSHQSRSVHLRAPTDREGAFALRRPGARRGLVGTHFVLTVRAEGYIEAVYIHDPAGAPLPAQTAAWPFADTKVLTKMPKTMTVRLAPALPVLVKAAASKNRLIRETAIEHLEELSRTAGGKLRGEAKEALEKIRTEKRK